MITTISNIKGCDLKPDLLRQFNIKPDQVITVTIQTKEDIVTTTKNIKKESIEFATWPLRVKDDLSRENIYDYL